jgi:hypothetical protein
MPGLIALLVATSVVISLVTFTFAHWLALGLALLVSWWVIEVIKRTQS